MALSSELFLDTMGLGVGLMLVLMKIPKNYFELDGTESLKNSQTLMSVMTQI